MQNRFDFQGKMTPLSSSAFTNQNLQISPNFPPELMPSLYYHLNINTPIYKSQYPTSSQRTTGLQQVISVPNTSQMKYQTQGYPIQANYHYSNLLQQRGSYLDISHCQRNFIKSSFSPTTQQIVPSGVFVNENPLIQRGLQEKSLRGSSLPFCFDQRPLQGYHPQYQTNQFVSQRVPVETPTMFVGTNYTQSKYPAWSFHQTEPLVNHPHKRGLSSNANTTNEENFQKERVDNEIKIEKNQSSLLSFFPKKENISNSTENKEDASNSTENKGSFLNMFNLSGLKDKVFSGLGKLIADGDGGGLESEKEVNTLFSQLTKEDSLTNEQKEEIAKSLQYLLAFHSKKEQNQEQISPTTHAKHYKKTRKNILKSANKFKKQLTMNQLQYFEDVDPDVLPNYQEFLNIYNEAIQSGNNFVDRAFPPNNKSIYEAYNSKKLEKWRNFFWRRPKDFLGGKYFIFDSEEKEGELINFRLRHVVDTTDAIEMDDIVQGSLGDCYFLSSLSALAENPFRIRNLFISKKINEDAGVYCVRICHEGQWQAVFVDDYFPCDHSGPCFSKSKKGENEIWVLILEKAWAKLYGNYERIEAGLTREVLRDLTGAPTKVVWTDDPNLWQEMMRGEERDYIMTAGAIDAEAMNNVEMHEGMVSGHAYSLISVHVIKGIKVVKLRNPWGFGEWKGPWSDTDPVWDLIPEETKKEVGFQRENDGTFFMGLDIFMKIYSDVQICMVENEYKYNSLELEGDRGHASYVEVDIQKEGEYFFTILQPTERKMCDVKDFVHSKSIIILAKREENDTFTYVIGKQKTHRENFIEANLTPGKYVLYCKVLWENFQKYQFVVSSYGVDNVALDEIYKPQEFLTQVYLSRAIKSEKKTSFEGIDLKKGSEVFVDEGFGYFYYENNGEKNIKVEVILEKFDNLKLCKEEKKKGRGSKGKIQLDFKGREIVVFKSLGRDYNLSVKENIEI